MYTIKNPAITIYEQDQISKAITSYFSDVIGNCLAALYSKLHYSFKRIHWQLSVHLHQLSNRQNGIFEMREDNLESRNLIDKNNNTRISKS